MTNPTPITNSITKITARPTAKTVAMMIISVLTALNAIFALVGVPALNLEPNVIYEICTAIWTVIVWARGFWKNQNWSPRAIKAQHRLDAEREL